MDRDWRPGNPCSVYSSALARGSSRQASNVNLAARANFDWRRKGLQCTLSVPRDDMVPVTGHRSNIRRMLRPAIAGGIPFAGNRLMIVEDEALVAMALHDTLHDLGFSIVGPFSRISEAMIALRSNHIDAAVLDVNLGGELIYPLADVLTAALCHSCSSPATAPRRSSGATRTSDPAKADRS